MECRRRSARGVARHGDARPEERALIRLILGSDAHRDRLQALEARRRLEIGALLAAVQCHAALRAVSAEVDVRRERRRAVEAARRRHGLDQPGEARTGHVNGRPGTLRAGTLIAPAFLSLMMFAAGILVAALPVLHFAVHRFSGALLLCLTVRPRQDFQLRCRFTGAAIVRRTAGTDKHGLSTYENILPRCRRSESVCNGNSRAFRVQPLIR